MQKKNQIRRTWSRRGGNKKKGRMKASNTKLGVGRVEGDYGKNKTYGKE